MVFPSILFFQTKNLICTEESKDQELKHEKKLNEKVVTERELTSSSDDEELKWLCKIRRGKKSRNALLEKRHTFIDNISKNENEMNEVTKVSTIQLVSGEGQVSEKEDERCDREPSSKSFSIESSVNIGNVNEKSAKSLIQKGSIKIKFKTNLLKTTIGKTSELKRKEAAPGSTGLITKDGKVHSDVTLITATQMVRILFPLLYQIYRHDLRVLSKILFRN